MNDFVNSFNKIVDKESNYSNIDKIFAELFKKANDFDIWHRRFKKSQNLNTKYLNICVGNKINDLQSKVEHTLKTYPGICKANRRKPL